MKKHLLSRKRLTTIMYSILMTLLCINVGWGQTTSTLPVYDGFDYTIGTGAAGLLGNANLANANGQGPWSTLAAVSADDTAIITSPTWTTGPGLSAGIQSPTGKALSILGSGADPQLNFTPLTGSFGTVYASCLMKVTSVSGITADLGDGTFFFSFGYVASGGSSTSYQSAVFIRRNGTGYNLGINKSTTAADTVWDSTVFAIDQEVFIVISYSDTFYPKLWINPLINGTEPTATQTNPTPRATSRPDRLRITQSTGALTPAIILDEIRVGMSWVDVTGPGVVIPITNYYYKGTGSLASESSWGTNTDGSGSNPANFTSDKQQFIIRNTTAVTTDAAWTVSGTDSKILLGDPSLSAVTLTVASSFPIAGIIDIPAASSGSNSLVLKDAATFPTFGTLHSSSEVHFQVTPTAITLSSNFGKLFIDGNSTMNLGAAGLSSTATIQTSLTVATGATLSIASTGTSYFYMNSGAVAAINGTFKTSRQGGFVSFSNSTVNTTSATYTALQFKDAETPGTSIVLAGGTIEYNRGNSVSAQVITPRSDYYNLTFSDGATAAANKTLASSLTVSGTLTLYHRNGSTITGAGSIILGNGATIVKTAGDFGTTLSFGSTVNVTYNGTTAQTAGVEIPGSGLATLIINNAVSVTFSSLTIESGATASVLKGNLIVDNTLVNNGTITLASGANLVQTAVADTNSGSGTAIVNRNSSALLRLDYTMWSSPVNGTQTLEQFSPNTSRDPNRFYTYNAGLNQFANVATTSTFTPGLGYLIRMPNDASAITPTAFAGVFTGTTFNNGTITLSGLTSEKFYLVGNPYPSTLDAAEFIAVNPGTLYFWRKTNGVANSNSAYATWTTLGGVVAGNVAPNNIQPDGTIQVGQGFIAKTGVGASTLVFTNSMRNGTASTQFFKTKNVTEKSRLWLNLTNTVGLFSQALVGYLDGATLGVDNGIDGAYINDSATALTSIVEGGEYTIQGRPAFDATDVVALGFKTDVAGDFTIAIDQKDGVLATQDIYLVDSKTGAETDLNASSYAFAAAAGVDNSRFSLKYQKTLKVIDATLDNNNVSVYQNNGAIYINSKSAAIRSVKVFDVQGRLIAEQRNVKANTAVISNLRAKNQLLIVNVVGEDNSEVSKKVMN